MPDQQPVLTPEQADENARQQKVSFSWLSKNLHRYRPSDKSAARIGAYIREHKLPWTESSLDTAMDALVASGKIEETENDSADVPIAPPAPPAADPNAPPWLAAGYSNPLTKNDIRRMQVPQMKSFLRDKRFGTLFEQQIRDLKLKNKGEIQQ